MFGCRRRRTLLALVVGAILALLTFAGASLSAFASPSSTSDGSAGRPKLHSAPLLQLNVGEQSLSVSVSGVSVNPGQLLKGLTGGSTAPSQHPTPSPTPHPSASPPASHPGTPAPSSHPAPSRATHRQARTTQPAARHPRLVSNVQYPRARSRALAHDGSAGPARRSRLTGSHRRSTHKHRTLGDQLLQEVARPGSPVQILSLLVLMCGIGTALMVSLARRKDPKPVPARASHRRR